MPFSCASDPCVPVQFDAEALENQILLPIGVENYTQFPGQPVRSAANNVVAWVLAAMRLGMSPNVNMTALGSDKATLAAAANDVIAAADLAPHERAAAAELVQGWLQGTLVEPTFESVLRIVVYGAYQLQTSETNRMLLVFSGHGALSGGRFVLCPSDTRPVADPAAPRDLVQELRDLAGRVKRAGEAYTSTEDADPEAAPLVTAGIVAIEAMAHKRNAWAHAELVDIVKIVVGDWERLGASPCGILEVVVAVAKHLAGAGGGAKKAGPVTPTYENVITPVHLMLAFGRNARRTTMVLDACHSGGLGMTLQGSEATHDWTDLGLEARIISSGQKAQRSAESSFGDRRYAAATWALTRVLSRWNNVEEVLPARKGASRGKAYAMGITNGNLVLRANLLLDALSFNQQISLSAPHPRSGARGVSDMPFMGYEAATRTYMDPNAEAGGIQLTSETNGIAIWKLKTAANGVVGALVAVAPQASWTNGTKTYAGGDNGRLYLIGDGNSITRLAGAFDMVMWAGATNSVPSDFASALSTPFDNQQLFAVDAKGLESQYTGPANPSGFASFTRPGGRPVWIKWLAPSGGDYGKCVFVGPGWPTTSVYGPSDFNAPNPNPVASTFTIGTQPNAPQWIHSISLTAPS